MVLSPNEMERLELFEFLATIFSIRKRADLLCHCNVIQRESSKEDVEKLILQAGGVKSLIGCLHGIASIHKGKANGFGVAKPSDAEKEGDKHFHIPDGLPKSPEEIEEEERSRMPDSPYTRLLRTKGKFPAWYSPVPDHETD